jgi:hypothetical protein
MSKAPTGKLSLKALVEDARGIGQNSHGRLEQSAKHTEF